MKKNIVLLHGWGASVEKLIPLGESLQKCGWSVLIPQLPGFDAPQPEEEWGVGEYASYVSVWAAKGFRGQKYIVFGHSFGGRVAIKMGVTDRLVEGLVLCATGGISRPPLVKRKVYSGLATLGRAAGLGGTWRNLLYKLAREHDYKKTSGTMRSIFRNVVSEDLKPLLHSVKVPTLIFWGQQDKMTPVSDAHTAHKLIKNSRLRVFENYGHRLPYENPKVLAGEIDKWL